MLPAAASKPAFSSDFSSAVRLEALHACDSICFSQQRQGGGPAPYVTRAQRQEGRLGDRAFQSLAGWTRAAHPRG